MTVQARILFVTDLHKACREMSTIKGRMEATSLIQQDIINFCKKGGVTHVVIAGDWYHRGYQSTYRTFNDFNEDKQLSDALNGNVYLCIGNHFFLERDDNPEMYIIQPCEFMRPAGQFTMPERPIFQAVRELVINDVKISFFHFNKMDKTYVNTREPNIKYHIGVYHDDYTLPSWVREKEGYVTTSCNDVLNRIYDNVDLAIHGHIHTKIDPFKFSTNTGHEVSVIVPGSLGITQNKESMKHSHVSLPIVDIFEDGSVSLKTAKFSTHLELLKFYKVDRKREGFDIKQKSAEDIRTMNLYSSSTARTLPAYIQSRGLSDMYLKYMESSITAPMSLIDVLNIFKGDST